MKKLTFILIALMLASLTNLSGQEQTKDLVDIDEFIELQMAILNKPGLSACIIKNDSIVWRGNYGYANLENSIPVNKDKLFTTGSISKSVNASSIMILWENDLISLDEDVNGFLPFQIHNHPTTNDSISTRMLMTHSSSILDINLEAYITIGDPEITLAYFIENYLALGGDYYSYNNFSDITPGTTFQYTNMGMGLNGYLAEALLNVPFNDYVKDSLLAPLQMDESGWLLSEIDTNNLATGYIYEGGTFVPYTNWGFLAYPAATLRTSSEELAHYLIMLMNGGNYLGNQILEEATVDTICSSHLSWSNGQVGLGILQTTLNCANENQLIWGHKGGGIQGIANEMQFCPEENIGIIYMSNSVGYSAPIVQRLFEYGALIVIPEDATNISATGFTANWQEAPDAVGYYLDVAYDFQFLLPVEGYNNLNVGMVTSYDVLDSMVDEDLRFYRIRGYNGIEDVGPYSSTVYLAFDSIYVNNDELPEATLNDNFQCYPVPIKDIATISYELQTKDMVSISLFNKIGQRVLEIYSGEQLKGEHHITFNATTLSSGIYFLRMKVGNEVIGKKVVKL